MTGTAITPYKLCVQKYNYFVIRPTVNHKSLVTVEYARTGLMIVECKICPTIIVHRM